MKVKMALKKVRWQGCWRGLGVWVLAGVLGLASVACGEKPPEPAASDVNSRVNGGAEAQAEEKAVPVVAMPAGWVDVASVYNGAFAVDRAEVMNATRLLSGMKNHGDYGILAPANSPDAQADFLIELAAPATIEQLRLIGPMNPHDAPAHLEVAVADALDGVFTVIATVSPEFPRNKDSQSNTFDMTVPVAEKHSGRFLRLRMSGNLMGDANKRYFAMASFQAWGQFDAMPELPEVQGVYHVQGEFGNDSSGGFYLVLHQQGSRVEGCAVVTRSAERPIRPERVLNRVLGGIQNGVLHLERRDAGGGKPAAGILTFSGDGEFVHSAFFRPERDPALFGSVDRALGRRVDRVPVACATGGDVGDGAGAQPAETVNPQWETALEQEKQLRLYGVNFDLDSDRLRKESYPVLDAVAAIAKAHPDWRFEVGGHTDSSGAKAHNQDLSQRRAAAVVKYLEKTGVDAKRLTPRGYGDEKPVMPNDTAAGMAQNRRVELMRL